MANPLENSPFRNSNVFHLLFSLHFSAPADMEASVLEALDSQRLQPILSSPFKMPKCRVSKCIYDLVDLALQTYQGR